MSHQVGSRVSDFTLFDMDRHLCSYSEFKGKNLVLAFYPGAFTSACKKEMCTLRDSIAKLEGLESQVLGISVNDPFSNKAFHEMNLLNFSLLCDYNREVVKLFGLELSDFAGLKGYTVAKRSVFIVDKEGVIRYRWVSENPGVEPNYEEIKEELKKL